MLESIRAKMTNLLTADEVASMLRVSKWQVYELSKERTRSGDVREDPIPTVKIGSSVRYRVEDITRWVDNQATKKRV